MRSLSLSTVGDTDHSSLSARSKRSTHVRQVEVATIGLRTSEVTILVSVISVSGLRFGSPDMTVTYTHA